MYPVMTCPHCDKDLDSIWVENDPTWEYDAKHGIYEKRDSFDGNRTIKCPHCEKDITDSIGKPEDFFMHNEVTDRNGVQRRCEYCVHFEPNTESEEPDGYCLEGGGCDEVGDMTAPLTGQDCNAFKLHPTLLERVDDLVVNDMGEIQECQN